jgi:prenylcysteine alpha-carboxyl methylesterase
MLSLTNIVS